MRNNNNNTHISIQP